MTKLEQESLKARAEAKAATKKLWEPQVPKRKVTLFNALGTTMFASGLALIIYVGYLLFYPFNPLTINSIKVMTPTVRAGSAMIYRISTCKNTQDTPTIYRKIVGTMGSAALPAVQGVVSPGCSVTNAFVVIPSGTPPGSYTLYTEVVYHVNALRDIHVFWHIGPFQVT